MDIDRLLNPKSAPAASAWPPFVAPRRAPREEGAAPGAPREAEATAMEEQDPAIPATFAPPPLPASAASDRPSHYECEFCYHRYETPTHEFILSPPIHSTSSVSFVTDGRIYPRTSLEWTEQGPVKRTRFFRKRKKITKKKSVRLLEVRKKDPNVYSRPPSPSSPNADEAALHDQIIHILQRLKEERRGPCNLHPWNWQPLQHEERCEAFEEEHRTVAVPLQF